MDEITVKTIGELGYYEGPNAIPGIRFRHAARDLGVTGWGMNVLEIEPNCSGYPQHDHAADGQEEVYVALRGSAILHAGGKEIRFGAGTLVRVGPTVIRKFVTGGDGLTLLALGATPGKAYAPRR